MHTSNEIAISQRRTITLLLNKIQFLWTVLTVGIRLRYLRRVQVKLKHLQNRLRLSEPMQCRVVVQSEIAEFWCWTRRIRIPAVGAGIAGNP